MIKILLAFALLAAPAFAQDQAAFAAAGCGSDKVKFDVKTDSHQHTVAQPQPGKALVYAFEDFPHTGAEIGGVTTVFGLDGTWIGANHDNSYFFFSVDPGDHKLCASVQSSVPGTSKLKAAASLTAEEGKVYYFRTSVLHVTDPNRPAEVKLEPVDPAEGQLLIGTSSFSTSRPKK